MVKMERAKGFEPSAQSAQTPHSQGNPQPVNPGYTQIRAQISNPRPPDLEKVIDAWPSLPKALKAAILAIVNSASADREGQP